MCAFSNAVFGSFVFVPWFRNYFAVTFVACFNNLDIYFFDLEKENNIRRFCKSGVTNFVLDLLLDFGTTFVLMLARLVLWISFLFALLWCYVEVLLFPQH